MDKDSRHPPSEVIRRTKLLVERIRRGGGGGDSQSEGKFFFPLRKTPPATVYKYLAPEMASVVLKTLQFRYSQPEVLDDPLEEGLSRDKIAERINGYEGGPVTIIDAFATEAEIQQMELVAKERRILHESGIFAPPFPMMVTAEGCDPQFDYAKNGEIIKRSLESHSAQTVSLSLAGRKDNVRLWSDYAVGHSGVVLGLNTRTRYFRMNRDRPAKPGFFTPITYCKLNDSHLRFLFPHERFLLKTPEWADQQEWRRLEKRGDATETKLDNAGRGLFLFKIPEGIIREVVFGVRCDDNCKTEVQRAIAEMPKECRPKMIQAVSEYGKPMTFTEC